MHGALVCSIPSTTTTSSTGRRLLYANHTYVDATFRSAPTLNSLYNPLNATPGINFTTLPRADPEGRRRALADAGAGGAVVVAASNLVLFGDEGQSERPAAGLCHARRPYLVRCHQARAALRHRQQCSRPAFCGSRTRRVAQRCAIDCVPAWAQALGVRGGRREPQAFTRWPPPRPAPH